ncbi:MAG: PAS domain S-box protein [Betaproteobacteria bacterium]
MKDQDRTKEELINELNLLRAQLKKSDCDKGRDCMKAEEALRESETRNRAIVAALPDLLFVFDEDARFVDYRVNTPGALLASPEHFIGKPAREILPPDIAALTEQKVKEVLSSGTMQVYSYSLVLHGDRRNFEARMVASGACEVLAIVRDITDQLKAEQSLRVNEARLREAQQIAHIGDWEWEIAKNKVHWSDELYRIYGYKPREISPDYGFVVNAMHPDSKEHFLKAIDAALRGKNPFDMEYTFFRKDGSVAVLQTIGNVVRNSDGAPERMVGIVQDITERKKAEESLLLFRNLLNQSQEAITVNDPATGRFLIVNDKACSDLGYTRSKLLTMRVLDIETIFPDQAAWDDHVTEVKSKGSLIVEGMNRRSDGTLFPVEVNATYTTLGQKDYIVAVVRDISERRRRDEAIRESEERFRRAFENAAVGASIVDTRGRFVKVNRRLCEMLGYSEEELLQRTFSDVTYPDDIQKGMDALAKLMGGETENISIEKRYIRKDGRIIYGIVSPSAIRDENGKPTHCLGLWQDITQRMEAEESLLLFRNLLNRSNDAIFVNDPATGRFLMVNDRACSNLGYDRNKLLAMRTLDVEAIFPDQAAWDAHVKEVKSKGYMILEGMNRRNDGTLFPVEVNVTYMTLGGTDYMVAVVRDTTERKLSEQALRTSEERLSKAQKMAHVGNWEWNIVTNELYWSEEVYHIYGVDPAQFIPTFDAVGKAMHPDDLGPFLKAVNTAIFEQKPFEMDYRLIRPDGTERTVHTIGEVSYDPAGKPLIKSGTVQDITEQKKAAEKLRQSEEFVRNILDTVDEGFIVIDRDLRILTANMAYCGQVGGTCDTVIGSHCYEISHRRLRPCYEEGEECAVRRVFNSGEPHTAVHKHRDTNGAILYVETKAFPIKDGSGAVTSVIETVNNITEKHLLQEERLKTQKLEAIGTLAGGIAHDFNNLLQGVFGYISMAKMTLDQKERSLAMLAQAEQALHMAVNLTKQLLTFSKGGKPVKKKTSLRPVIENSVKFALSGSRVDYRITFDEDLRPVDADEGQIGQVIQNIVLNAEQSMPLGGTIVITARNVRAPNTTRLPHLLEKGNYIEISVQDSGIGIPEPYLQKIFDPYFTTKEKGSGLGLATSYSIIRNHGGVIDVVSEAGTGTVCSIYLPATDAETESPEAPAVSPVVRKGKILVMDDEELIRDIAGEMLKICGHEVEFAEHGDAAIEKYQAAREAGNPFDILILDLTVRGGLGGKETIKRLLAIDPGVKAIVSSGYSNDNALADHRAYGFAACLTKPYHLEELADTLNALLT